MSLKYALFQNHLTEDSNDYIARLQEVETANIDVLIKEMVVPGGVTETQLRAVLTSHRNTILRLLRLGFAINDGLVRIYPSISGVFENEETPYNPERHKIIVHTSPSKQLRNSLLDSQLSRVQATSNGPEISKFEDFKSKKKDEAFTAGKMAKLKGSNIFFDETDTEQGVFFVATDGSETRCQDYAEVMPSSVIFMNPDSLAAGEYKITLRSKKGLEKRIVETSFKKSIIKE